MGHRVVKVSGSDVGAMNRTILIVSICSPTAAKGRFSSTKQPSVGRYDFILIISGAMHRTLPFLGYFVLITNN
jgi:hypothetical protein